MINKNPNFILRFSMMLGFLFICPFAFFRMMGHDLRHLLRHKIFVHCLNLRYTAGCLTCGKQIIDENDGVSIDDWEKWE